MVPSCFVFNRRTESAEETALQTFDLFLIHHHGPDVEIFQARSGVILDDLVTELMNQVVLQSVDLLISPVQFSLQPLIILGPEVMRIIPPLPIQALLVNLDPLMQSRHPGSEGIYFAAIPTEVAHVHVNRDDVPTVGKDRAGQVLN